jgi:hypothetical protein
MGESLAHGPEPRLTREVVVPPVRDPAAFHRTIAALSICVAVAAGLVDTLLWQAAKHETRARAAAARSDIEELERQIDRHLQEIESRKYIDRLVLPPRRKLRDLPPYLLADPVEAVAVGAARP